MASDYEAICAENRERYGTDIGRIAPMLLVDRYDERTHFIFELLQNAEDALGRRDRWAGQRHVAFTLEPERLVLSHFGRPFDGADVRGICGIAQTTKDEPSIGRFGIGFKSVYTFTARPEIHSGDEHFAIENYVSPVAAPPAVRTPDETLIVLPFNQGDLTAPREIADGFKRLGPEALLFLRHIEEINWTVQGGASGFYQRSAPQPMGVNVNRITVIGQEGGQPEVDQNWLVFHREVMSTGGESVGRAEVAFSLHPLKERADRWSVVPLATSPLAVFFPTAVETNLGFLVQGPYLTTPSRDNIPRHDPWNQRLVEITADLVVEAMRWLRDHEMLDVVALRSLPLDREKFSDGAMFGPVFGAVREAFSREPLLPQHGGGYVAASNARLARTQEVRDLFSPTQVAQLFGGQEAAWLSGDITQDRAPEIRQYAMRELGVAEVTPDTILPRLTQGFLERQLDEWVQRLYQFLGGQPALKRRFETLPLIRLSDGRHVVAMVGDQSQAFLPSDIETGFPTVRRAVCAVPEARIFLVSLGIKEPDPVDDVILNVLHKYRGSPPLIVSDEQYAKDMDRIVAAFRTDSKTQREKLLAALRDTTFVRVVNAGDETVWFAPPGIVYIATDRLKRLFAGVPGVMLTDDSQDCLRGEGVREVLEASGAVRYPRPVESPQALSYFEKQELRRNAGHEESSGVNDQVVDWLLQGFDKLLAVLPTLPVEKRAERARLLWESLGDLEERRGLGIFDGLYRWTHYGHYKTEFPAAFVRRLNDAAWVPDANGDLHAPRLVMFEVLEWELNPFLQSKIRFKPPIIDQLAREAGIDPAALDLLRKLGITSVAELTSRLGIRSDTNDAEKEGAGQDKPSVSEPDVYAGAKDLYGGDMPPIPPGTPDPEGGDDVRPRTGQADDRKPNGGGTAGGTRAGGGTGGVGGSRSGAGTGGQGSTHSAGAAGGGSSTGNGGGDGGARPFISYVAVHGNDDDRDPDGLDQSARMRIEEMAIEYIVRLEPSLLRTPEGNPGFDLFEVDPRGLPVRWVEVKAMTGSLKNRPVGMSHTQFECARLRGAAYWLYVVEYAADATRARVLRIQDPAGQARTFTFDSGWADVARVEGPFGAGSVSSALSSEKEAPVQ